MADWNEQAAPNNNLPSKTIRTSKLVKSEKQQMSESSSNKRKKS